MVFNKSLLVCKLNRKNYGRLAIYNVILTFKNKPKGGLVLEKLGFLSLESNNKIFFMDFEMLAFWLNNGAKLTPSVKKYIVNFVGF